jgi:phosphoenolpyruvate synthase/pyruvate phosphate dikinase
MEASRVLNQFAFNESRTESMAVAGRIVVKLFKGYPASEGVAVGQCRIASSPEELRTVEKDAILFFESASPSLAAVMSRVAGIVTRQGGPLAIGANYARLFDVPAVVGIGHFVGNVNDGDHVLVDGSAGKVYVLGDPYETMARP